jgi:hypothetical protein
MLETPTQRLLFRVAVPRAAVVLAREFSSSLGIVAAHFVKLRPDRLLFDRGTPG